MRDSWFHGESRLEPPLPGDEVRCYDFFPARLADTEGINDLFVDNSSITACQLYLKNALSHSRIQRPLTICLDVSAGEEAN